MNTYRKTAIHVGVLFLIALFFNIIASNIYDLFLMLRTTLLLFIPIKFR